MSVKIKLTDDSFTLVDDIDVPYVQLYSWYWDYHQSKVCRTLDKLPLSRFILRDSLKNNPELVVDHISGDGRDNTRGNLRTGTKAQNAYNRKKRINKMSKFKGTDWAVRHKKWVARIMFNGRRMFLGYFDTEVEAAAAYNDAAKYYFGEFAKLNNLES